MPGLKGTAAELERIHFMLGHILGRRSRAQPLVQHAPADLRITAFGQTHNHLVERNVLLVLDQRKDEALMGSRRETVLARSCGAPPHRVPRVQSNG